MLQRSNALRSSPKKRHDRERSLSLDQIAIEPVQALARGKPDPEHVEQQPRQLLPRRRMLRRLRDERQRIL